MKKVGVVGVGYVGLTQAVGMAQLGHSVVAYDIAEEKINKLKNGNSPFFEPGLEEALVNAQGKNLISFTSNVETLIDAKYIFLCLPTPQEEDGSADLSYLLEAASKIKDILKSNTYLIIKSTVPVHSWKQVAQIVSRDDIFVISNPEFLREGSALHDFHNPDRIVIGATDKELAQLVAELYKNISSKFLLTDNTSAELIKYASNSFLAIKLSFVNDIAALSDNLNANSLDVLKGVGLDNRIGNRFLTPGPGWGGSCFPKDIRALAKIANNSQILFPLLDSALESNENARLRVLKKSKELMNNELKGKNITALGLAFKANTDDIRNSPAVDIVKLLTDAGANVKTFDPKVKNLKNLKIEKNIFESLKEADLIIILTEWPEFEALDPKRVATLVNKRIVMDTRRILNFDRWIKEGFQVYF